MQSKWLLYFGKYGYGGHVDIKCKSSNVPLIRFQMKRQIGMQKCHIFWSKFLSWIFLVNIFAEVHSVFIAKTDLERRLRADSSILKIDFVKYQNWFPYYPLPNAKIWEISFGKLVLERFTTQYLNSLNCSGHGKRCLAHFVLIFYYIELPQKSKQNEPGIFCHGCSY